MLYRMHTEQTGIERLRADCFGKPCCAVSLRRGPALHTVDLEGQCWYPHTKGQPEVEGRGWDFLQLYTLKI